MELPVVLSLQADLPQNSFSLKKIQAPVYSGKWGIDIGQPIR